MDCVWITWTKNGSYMDRKWIVNGLWMNCEWVVNGLWIGYMDFEWIASILDGMCMDCMDEKWILDGFHRSKMDSEMIT